MFGIMRTGRGFGVVLNAENRKCFVLNSGYRVVVDIHMGNFNAVGKAFAVDRKPMIVRGDLDLVRSKVLDRLIAAAVTKFHLKCFRTKALSEYLMSKADSKKRRIGFNNILNFGHNSIH